MSYPVYLRYEVLRNFRNWRFLILTLVFPLVLYLVVGSVNRHVKFDGIAFPVYFMTAMATLGTMAAVVSGSASSRPNGRPAGPARCGSPRSRSGPTSGPRCSSATCGRC